jgi:hypothetical protein
MCTTRWGYPLKHMRRYSSGFEAAAKRCLTMTIQGMATDVGAAYVTDPGGHVVEFWPWDVAGHLSELTAGESPGSH